MRSSVPCAGSTDTRNCGMGCIRPLRMLLSNWPRGLKSMRSTLVLWSGYSNCSAMCSESCPTGLGIPDHGTPATVMRMANPPDGLPRVVAHLIYADVDAAVEWLCRVFGFEERVFARHLGEDGRIGRTQLQVEDSVITVGQPSIHGASPREGVSSMLYVYVGD